MEGRVEDSAKQGETPMLSPQMQVWLQEAQNSGIDTSAVELLQAMQNFNTSLASTGIASLFLAEVLPIFFLCLDAEIQATDAAKVVADTKDDIEALAALYDVGALKALIGDPGEHIVQFDTVLSAILRDGAYANFYS